MDIIDLVSDLEEGEILDDSPSSSSSEKKIRELPQRYIIREKNTPVQKHKKDCKYAIRCHAKKPSKKKMPKSKDSSKRYRKSSCHHEKSHKLPDKSSKSQAMNFPKNGYSKSSLIAEIKSSLKEPVMKTEQTQQHNLSNTGSFKSSNVFNLAEKGRKNNFQPENSIVCLEKDCPPVLNITNLRNSDKENSGSDIKFSSNLTCDRSLPTKNEESEDEEELRRIALATCSKRKTITESSANLVQSFNSNSILSVPEFLGNNDIRILHPEISSPAPDNYEIVDMEVDEDIQTSIEVLDAAVKDYNSEPMEKLYVIDTKPFADLERGIQKNVLPEEQSRNSSDEDFETDILRAELIGNLYEKKDEYIEQKRRVNTHPKQVPVLPKKKSIGNYKKSNFSFYRKQLRSGKHVLKKTIVNNKCENLSCNVKKTIVTSQVNKPSKRLIIALNEESSSENSDTENPVASIEALISDCRQKSSVLSTDKTEEAVVPVPKAVSCLSKAQQEEYTSLRKILAEKEKLQGPSNRTQPKNESVRLSTDDIKKQLEEKLFLHKEMLKKEIESMAHLSKEVSSKKLLYMKSKLTAEHLKEQYIAAEKNRKVNFLAWSKSCTDFKNEKKKVSNIESTIKELEHLRSKVDASTQGQTLK